MNVAKRLYQLQEIDLELESTEQTLKQISSQLRESRTVVSARVKLVSEQQRLEELKHQQHSAEWEIDDLTVKITTAEEKLYGGKITNPKELADFQHEADSLKARRAHLEDTTLELMDQVELVTASVAKISSKFETLETEWHSQQQKLSAEMEQLKNKLSDLKQKRQLLSAEIDPETLELYDGLKKQKGTAVAKIEQGICRGCSISLSISELQRARSGNPVRCSSCGRILFLA